MNVDEAHSVFLPRRDGDRVSFHACEHTHAHSHAHTLSLYRLDRVETCSSVLPDDPPPPPSRNTDAYKTAL